MKLLKLLIALVFVTSAAGGQTVGVKQSEAAREVRVKPLGTFMKVWSNGEHASGYEVELWKQGAQIFGMIHAHRGLIGDPPAGLLENVRFDPKTRKFSFTAKLSLGQFSENKGTHDLFKFEGALTGTRLTGTLLITEEQWGAPCTKKKKINLPCSKAWSREMEEFKSYAEWKTKADKILDFRGPRW